jgi:hypothetical protein
VTSRALERAVAATEAGWLARTAPIARSCANDGEEMFASGMLGDRRPGPGCRTGCRPAGIGIPPIADMDVHQTIVAAALAAKSSAETPKKARWEARSETMRREISRPGLRQRHHD